MIRLMSTCCILFSSKISRGIWNPISLNSIEISFIRLWGSKIVITSFIDSLTLTILFKGSILLTSSAEWSNLFFKLNFSSLLEFKIVFSFLRHDLLEIVSKQSSAIFIIHETGVIISWLIDAERIVCEWFFSLSY